MDLVNALVDFESGEMDDGQIVALFQELVETGLAWQLQGSYGRLAAELIRAGAVSPPGGKVH